MILYINKKHQKNSHSFQKYLSYLITINDETVLLRTGVNFTLTDFLSPGFNIRLKTEWRARPFVSPTVLCNGWTLREWGKQSNTLKYRNFLHIIDRNYIILVEDWSCHKAVYYPMLYTGFVNQKVWQHRNFALLVNHLCLLRSRRT